MKTTMAYIIDSSNGLTGNEYWFFEKDNNFYKQLDAEKNFVKSSDVGNIHILYGQLTYNENDLDDYKIISCNIIEEIN